VSGILLSKGRVLIHQRSCLWLPACSSMLPAMFLVNDIAAAAIRAIYEQEGELSAAIELRRLFPGVTDNAKARECARTIAGWKPLPPAPKKRRDASRVASLHARKPSS
jgi:hypothetical protein